MPAVVRPRGGLRQWVHAALLKHGMRRYERLVADRKAELFADVGGRVVEIGPGTGPNLKWLGSCASWIGVEPNPYWHGVLMAEAARHGIAADVVPSAAERVDLPSASADVVIATLALCSVRDPWAVLAEAHRLLTPDGRFMLLEHVADEEGTRLRRFQARVSRTWAAFADGCRPDRETAGVVRASGFEFERLDLFRLPVPVVGPHIAGVARKQSPG